MRISRESDASQGEIINISSLLDVLFILVIFFLVTSNFEEQERDHKVSLVEAGEPLTASSQTDTLIINIYEDGSLILGDNKASLEQIESKLRLLRRANPEQQVLIRGDQRAVHGMVQRVMLLCKQCGFPDPRIGYAPLTQ